MRLRSTLLVLLLATIGMAAQMSADAGAVSTPERALVRQTEGLLRDSITSDSRPCGPGVTQCFANGVWQSANPADLWYCQVAPGTSSAVLWRATGRGDQRLWHLAVSTFDTAIAKHRSANGSVGTDIASMMFGVELGTTYLELEPWLGSARRARWLRALTGIANFLISNGNLTWYTNGNINVGNAELFYLAWRASGDRRYSNAYNEALNFALRPPQSRWPGFGLHILPQVPARDGYPAGYLAESGGGAAGFDADYTQLQLDVVSRLYVLSGDPRALSLADMLVNALLPRVSPQWLLNTSGGTRHPQQGRHVPFTTPALAVLSWLGNRRDLARLFPSQLAVIKQVYRGALTYSSPGLYRGLGNEVAAILQAALADNPAAGVAMVKFPTGERRHGRRGAPIATVIVGEQI